MEVLNDFKNLKIATISDVFYFYTYKNNMVLQA
jgi:hypothetical protein